jgi:ribosomal protein S18 acetylase RimI-like enzyme
VRATLDAAGSDAHGRPSRIQIRRIGKGDLAHARDVVEVAFTDWLERHTGTRPRTVFGGAQYVHHRWLMEPWGSFVAEEDGAKIIGVALAVTWGSLGIVGPLAILTSYQNQAIAQQLLRAVDEFFEEQKTALQGVVTYPTSAKHLRLYHKFGYKPKQLAVIMSRAIDRRGPVVESAVVPARGAKTPSPTPLRFSTLDEARKQATLARIQKITHAIARGLDLRKEVEIADGLGLGDTLLLERGRDLLGFAIYHTPGVSEAPAGSLSVKFCAVDPLHKRVEHLEQLVSALEDTAAGAGLARVVLPVYLRYWAAYSTLVKCGYEIDMSMVRMQRGKQEDYEDPAHLVLDDWR